MPKLLHAARGCLRVLGWCEDARHRPYMLEPQELVNHAIESLLAGERRWVPEAGVSEESLMAFLCETMRSIAMNRRTSAAIERHGDADALDQQRDEAPSPSRDLAAREHLQLIDRALAPDPEALALHRMECQGYTDRKEVAAALGWTEQQVKVVRWRASKRLAALKITLDDDGEQPGSEP